jgi:hypothetical protein
VSGERISWETVEVFGVRGMAEVAGSALRGAGIPFRIMADDGGSTMQLPFSLRTRGAELQVPAEDVEDARTLLAGEIPLEGMDLAEAYASGPAEDGVAPHLRRSGLVVVGRLLAAAALVAVLISLLGGIG